ncbi:MAG: acyl-ACP--UDP-N-acetylglucosamine O-acyltransferase [Casimicrobiaceae bacterium]|nr:acyl-ACP--UDP-N-acetylglucosamine O-acyltransferase [Casimicrobiaceae bacterium]MCX8098964.1 acyl-ACP--UDP-N-acetylglucosamine O-acyltransferase [Casimicrobiaceae bacterium]MDW8312466.1 acyl-ACP--UDP-N-acetylglucosamine O-acyltransferase [Burkholderiales bacterium]
MARIHPTAIVEASVELEENVEIGPYCRVGPHVRIGRDSRLISHVIVEGPTVLGARTTIHPFACVGVAPQDKKYRGEPTRLEIGDDTTIRECATVSRGTLGGAGVTRIGARVLLMAYTHVAHDCVVEDDAILANAATLAGHVTVGRYAILGGLAAVHQFTRVGAHAMVGGCSCVLQDVAPYALGHGNPFSVTSVNVEGLKRRGFSREAIAALREAYRIVFRSGLTLTEALKRLAERAAQADCDVRAALEPLIEFLQVPGRGLAR